MEPNSFRDYYADLGLQIGASYSSIRAAFHTLAKQHHPDKSGDTDAAAFRCVREAYDKLYDASYRAAYDNTYWDKKRNADIHTDADGAGDEGLGYTRTAQYEHEQQRRPPSPPPTKPVRKSGEPSWKYFLGKPYLAWQKRDEAYRARHPELYEENQTQEPSTSAPTAHGLSVQMTSHPAANQRCAIGSWKWRVQAGGTDHCIFCMAPTVAGSRCSGCEALACQKCLREISELERKAFGGINAEGQFRASGA